MSITFTDGLGNSREVKLEEFHPDAMLGTMDSPIITRQIPHLLHHLDKSLCIQTNLPWQSF